MKLIMDAFEDPDLCNKENTRLTPATKKINNSNYTNVNYLR